MCSLTLEYSQLAINSWPNVPGPGSSTHYDFKICLHSGSCPLTLYSFELTHFH